MSSSCTLLNSSSPTPATTPRNSSDSRYTRAYADLVSPRRSSSAHFNQPSLKPGSKWKAVLAHLSPARLTNFRRPGSAASSVKPATPCITGAAASEYNISSAVISCSSSRTNDLPSGPVPSAPSTGRTTAPAAIAHQDNLLTSPDSFPLTVDVASDVQKLLDILVVETPPLAEPDIYKRTHALAALCALCVSSPANVNQCVAAGGVQIIVDVLNSTAQRASQAPPPSAAIVEESEKALLLLQLLTTSSEDGCIASLQHSSAMIATLGKKLLRGSESCTASTIAVLTALCRHTDATLFAEAVSETAIPSKLVVVLQVASKESTKRRAGRLLRLLAEPGQHTGGRNSRDDNSWAH